MLKSNVKVSYNGGYFDGGGGILMAFRQSTYHDVPEVEEAVKEIESLTGLKRAFILINKIPPGIRSEVHTDTLKLPVQRWHLPLVTNPKAWFWQETFLHMEIGYWYNVKYWLPHSVGNDGPTDRIHLVVDLI